MESSGQNAGLITFVNIVFVIMIVGLIVAYIVIKP
jgi:hypothetical protein